LARVERAWGSFGNVQKTPRIYPGGGAYNLSPYKIWRL